MQLFSPAAVRVRLALVTSLLAAGLSAGLLVSGAYASGDVNQAACANEANSGFSAALPDCRAFEQVSPVFKGGFAFAYNFALAEGPQVEGEHIEANSLGAIGGGNPPPGATATNYELSRSSSGWSFSPLGAPLTQFAYPETLAPPVLGDHGETLLLIRPLESSIYEGDLYLRAASGALSEIGPTLPASALPAAPTGSRSPTPGTGYAGALIGTSTSPGFSHVLFQLVPLEPSQLPPGITTTLWPGDQTVIQGNQGASLYEYTGVGNAEPELVGVRNEGPLHGSPHVNEGAELISQCATFLGSAVEAGTSHTENKHNAISENGARVFFTAEGADEHECGGAQPHAGELYARVDGAKTEPISEPSRQKACTSAACVADTGPGHEANFRDANYEGASADGSRVFFTSTQKLLDDATQDPSEEDSATHGSELGCHPVEGVNGCNLYEYDFNAPEGENLTDLSAGDTSGGGPQVQGVTAISEDGSRVYFVAKGVLASNKNQYGAEATAGNDNLYTTDAITGTTTFIATLSPADNKYPNEQWASTESDPMNVTSDGRFLVFSSVADLTPDDTSSAPQVFRYDAASGELTRVSIGDEGFNSDGNTPGDAASISTVAFGAGRAGLPTAHVSLHPAVSEDGSTIVFTSAAQLTPGAPESECTFEENGTCFNYASEKLYEYREGRVFLISSSTPVGEGWISISGQDIFFKTSESLVPSDTDSQRDIYDARSDGGFLVSAHGGACEGERCQGPVEPSRGASSQPVFASSSLAGVGNVVGSAPVPVSPKPKALTTSQKLTRALRVCQRKRNKKIRKACEAQAHKRYRGVKSKKASDSGRAR
jgi:hypothetical protein